MSADKTIEIIVNARPRQVAKEDLSYTEVVVIAFPDDAANTDKEFTVAYSNPHGQDGTLVSGQSVKVKKGMVFLVTKTNRS